MEPIHIIVEETVEPSFDFNWMELIEFLVGTLSTIISIGVMIIGIRAINRLQQKGEDAIFNFLSRFSVYLELLKDMIGTSQNSVYYYKFTDDLRSNLYTEQTPSKDYLDKFIGLSKEIMDFLKDTDNQFAITEDYFFNRKELLKILINNVSNLGKVFPYTSNTIDMGKEISKDVSIINNLLNEINNYTSITLNHYWKKIKKRYKSKKVSSNNQAGLCQEQGDNFFSDDSNSGNEEV